MSASEVVIFEPSNLPAALLSQDHLGLGKALTGGLGSGVNRISIKGSRFRLVQAGQEVAVLQQSDLDVVIVGATPSVSRIYYKGKYSGEEKVKPTCWSKDGIKPDTAVAQDQVQSKNCASCPQNIKGSAVGENGVQSRACAFRKRIVVVSRTQLGTGETPEAYALDVNAISLFGDGLPNQNKFSLSGYGRYLSTPRGGFPNGIPPGVVVTRLSLDTNSSVPKLFFGVATNEAGRAAFLNTEQANEVVALSKSDAVTRLINATAEEVVSDSVDDVPALEKAHAVVDVASPPPKASPPPPKAPTWQEVAADNGADEDDIELIEAAGGPYTEKGRKRWDKVVDVEPPKVEVKAAKKQKTSEVEVVQTQTKKVNPFSADPAPVAVSSPAKPKGVSAEVGVKLAGKLSAFDDDGE